MNFIKYALAIILSLAIVTGNPMAVQTPVGAASSTYVALGDSITTGYGLESFNFGDVKNLTSKSCFVTMLGQKLKMETFNYAVEGDDSTNLLKKLSQPTTEQDKKAVEKIKTAGLITISIGGNNLLPYLEEGVQEQLPSGKTFETATSQDLTEAFKKMIFDNEKYQKLCSNIKGGVERFIGKDQAPGEFDRIIASIKELNPNAQIVVQTVYNPYANSILSNLGDLTNSIKNINAEIIKGSQSGKYYKVADVYTAFSKAGKETRLINADFSTTLDPHPNRQGHRTIYSLLSYTITNKFPYNVKVTATKCTVVAKLADGEFKFTVTPSKGYKLPKAISLTMGKTKKVLTLNKGIAAIPLADVNTDLALTAVCTK